MITFHRQRQQYFSRRRRLHGANTAGRKQWWKSSRLMDMALAKNRARPPDQPTPSAWRQPRRTRHARPRASKVGRSRPGRTGLQVEFWGTEIAEAEPERAPTLERIGTTTTLSAAAKTFQLTR